MKIFSHKILRTFLFFRKSIYPILFLFFIFKSSQQNRTITSPKYSISTPSHSHFNFIFSSSFSFHAPPHFSQYIPPKHLHHTIHPFIHHFALNNIKTFLYSNLQKMPNTTPLLDSLHLSFISLFQIHFSLSSTSAQTVIKNT